MRDILNKIKEILAPFKTPIIVLAAILVAYLAISKIMPIVQNKMVEGSPVVEIEAENKKVYKVTEKIKESDFKVKAVHENKRSSRLSSDDFTLSRKTLMNAGKYTKVTITLKDDKNITCDINVKVERKPLVRFKCGRPVLNDVVATLFSNGELYFEGKGNVFEFGESSYPWKNYDDDDDHPILAVNFAKGVEPTNMDDWFSGITSLRYAYNIPDSVERMESTFSGCGSLVEVGSLVEKEKLTDITACFSDCISLKNAPALPPHIRKADEAFSGCTSLKVTPTFEGVEDLVTMYGMFKECEGLTNAIIPESAVEIASMFEDCINLEAMPEIPASVKNMNSTFSGCVTLKTLTAIPKNVKDAGNCFTGCKQISGKLWVDANPTEGYSGFLSGAAITTDIDLQGNSYMLDVLANTADESMGITVNGKKPNAEMLTPNDVKEDE